VSSRLLEGVDGQALDFDADGHLVDPAQWSPALAEALAAQDGLELTEEHWWVIDFVRQHHRDYGTPPLMRSVIAAWRKARGNPALGSRDLYRLFAENPVRQACRLGGYPKPDWCL
jgi:tRNA 2-thiouridine synthesizing protein E